jgi:hypothetical protein
MKALPRARLGYSCRGDAKLQAGLFRRENGMTLSG